MTFVFLRYLFMRGAPRSVKISAVMTFMGIAIAVAVLIVSLSVAKGFETSYKRSILDFNAHLILTDQSGEFGNYNEIKGKISLYDGISGVEPFIYRESMAVRDGIIKGVVIKGTGAGLNLKKFGREESEGKFQAFLGKALAKRLGVTEKTAVSLMLENNNFKNIEAIGTFESGLYDYDSQFVLMKIADVQRLFNVPDVVSGIEIRLLNPDDAAPMARLLEEEFHYPYQFTTWEELNKPIFEAVRLEKIMFAVIMGTLVLVAMFNIISTLVLKVLYKLKDISILSAIGMRKKTLRVMFTFHGIVLGMSATLTGSVMGVLFAGALARWEFIHIEPEIYFLSSLPVAIEWNLIALILFTGTVVSLFVSYFAAIRVVGTEMAEGLKYV